MEANVGDRVGVVRYPSGYVLPDGRTADLVGIVPEGQGDFDATVSHAEAVSPGRLYRFDGKPRDCFDDGTGEG